jgi:hypothetical protein
VAKTGGGSLAWSLSLLCGGKGRSIWMAYVGRALPRGSPANYNKAGGGGGEGTTVARAWGQGMTGRQCW